MNCKASNWYCIRASAVVGTVMPTVRQVIGTASELVPVVGTVMQTVRQVTGTASELVLL